MNLSLTHIVAVFLLFNSLEIELQMFGDLRSNSLELGLQTPVASSLAKWTLH